MSRAALHSTTFDGAVLVDTGFRGAGFGEPAGGRPASFSDLASAALDGTDSAGTRADDADPNNAGAGPAVGVLLFTLDAALAQDLRASVAGGAVTPAVHQAFSDQGFALLDGTQATGSSGSSWRIDNGDESRPPTVLRGNYAVFSVILREGPPRLAVYGTYVWVARVRAEDRKLYVTKVECALTTPDPSMASAESGCPNGDLESSWPLPCAPDPDNPGWCLPIGS
ncbi:hypothetical protein [Streptomyces sp. SID3343]|uniref:hypothetical protein n=1 Tax=Streptomyces sp. SID3343 TaxID=2690260 RepID=UPI001370F3DE|nr:hypothetical protein [Streptomyces sp. SID3343]MYW03610.1 hypothetical protein [Streptomyces sp. SID3343]